MKFNNIMYACKMYIKIKTSDSFSGNGITPHKGLNGISKLPWN